MRLLLVEDDALLGDGTRVGLDQAGYRVDWVRDGVAASLALETEAFDGVVLDLGLPRRSGLEVLTRLRASGNDVPVLILTAQGATDQRVRGLDSGADDYLVKPFDLDELAARLRALMRRRGGQAQPLLVEGDLVLDPETHRVTLAGVEVQMSRREFAILEALLLAGGRVLSRERLEQLLYGWDSEIKSNAVEVYISHLRQKLGKQRIRTLRGVGYLLARSTA
ncbi:MAG: response regulator [Gammaproteobacteria bacterium]|nr:response regulator [Gammaproteobacteria bacterium]